MSEFETEPQSESEPTIEDLINALNGFVEPEELEELREMDFDDAIGYSFTLLLESPKFLELGKDPESYLIEKHILE